MIGETTLAMLYVPLFFYIFDRLKERRSGSTTAVADDARASEGAAPIANAPQEAD